MILDKRSTCLALTCFMVLYPYDNSYLVFVFFQSYYFRVLFVN